jgi:hypothetical protein
MGISGEVIPGRPAGTEPGIQKLALPVVLDCGCVPAGAPRNDGD